MLLYSLTAAALGIAAARAVSRDPADIGLLPFGSALLGIFTVALGLTHNRGFAVAWLVGSGIGAGLLAFPLSEWRGSVLTGLVVAATLGAPMFWSGLPVVLVGLAILFWSALLIRRFPQMTIRFLLWCVMHTLFRVRVQGSENIPKSGGALLVSNHISYADSVLVGQCTRRIPRFLMWRPIYNTPGARFFFQVLHAIPISPESPKSTIQALRQARAVIQSGELVAIFPEGSITRTGEIEPFQRGFERIVQGLDTPIIPVHVQGLWGHPLSTKGGKVFASWTKLWRPVVDIHIGDAIYGPIAPSELREIVLELATDRKPCAVTS